MFERVKGRVVDMLHCLFTAEHVCTIELVNKRVCGSCTHPHYMYMVVYVLLPDIHILMSSFLAIRRVVVSGGWSNRF